MKMMVLLLIFFLLALTDKVLTAANFHYAEKNGYTNNNHYGIERNPLAKKIYTYFGTLNGSIVMLLFSLCTLFLMYIIIGRSSFSAYALYIPFMIYGLVIVNNIFFLLRYSGVTK